MQRTSQKYLERSQAIANAIHFLNENYVKLCVHKKENMRVERLEKLETSNGMLSKIYWMGNLVCNQRRRNGQLDDIEVDS